MLELEDSYGARYKISDTFSVPVDSHSINLVDIVLTGKIFTPAKMKDENRFSGIFVSLRR